MRPAVLGQCHLQWRGKRFRRRVDGRVGRSLLRRHLVHRRHVSHRCITIPLPGEAHHLLGLLLQHLQVRKSDRL